MWVAFLFMAQGGYERATNVSSENNDQERLENLNALDMTCPQCGVVVLYNGLCMYIPMNGLHGHSNVVTRPIQGGTYALV